MILTPSDLLALCQRHGAPPGVARIATACALVESGGDTEAVGDAGHSIGLWQMHDRGLGAGMTVAERQDPDTAADRMLPNFTEQWVEGMGQGLTGERLARYVAIWTERPAGWPDLDSPAGDKYAAMWRTLEEPIVADDLRQAFLAKIREYTGKPYHFGGKSPTESFDCSGILTYAGQQVGLALGDPYYTSADGLKGYCDPIGMDEVLPGDLYLFHTTYGSGGTDYATHCGAALGDGRHMLDTHGDPWPGVGQTEIGSPYWQAHLMGAWRPRGYGAASEEEDPEMIAELQQQIEDDRVLIATIQDDWAAAAEAAVLDAQLTRNKAARDAKLDAALAALATIRRGGPPSEDGE